MTGENEGTNGLEARARELLASSLVRIDARTRSRLTEARHAALAAALERRRSLWRSPKLMPVTGAVAAAAVAAVLILYGRQAGPAAPATGASQPSLEVLDLLTSDESMSLVENYDGGFYEWAAAQAEGSVAEGGHAKPTT